LTFSSACTQLRWRSFVGIYRNVRRQPKRRDRPDVNQSVPGAAPDEINKIRDATAL
jgi:hypothetical protein